MEHSAAHVTPLFGLDPMWLSAAILITVYAVLVTERVNRAVIALLGATLCIFTGLLDQARAVAAIDFNTIFLLTGMMILVNITAKTGVFQYVAIRSAKWVRASPPGVLLVLTGVTAVFSAFLDNVTTVLLITPVALLIAEQLGVRALPFFLVIIFASNVGGTATMIGDPPNILIGSLTHLSFTDFIVHLAPVVALIVLLMCGALWLLCRTRMRATLKARARIMRYDEKRAITDPRLLKTCGVVLALVLLGFFAGHSLHLEPGTVALAGAALLMLLAYGRLPGQQQSERVRETFAEIELITIFFFMGLFMIVGAVEQSGLLALLGEKLIAATGGDIGHMTFTVLWVSAVLSSVLDNIPFVATMVPLLQSAAGHVGGADFDPVWWALALGACLGGNGTLIGASANLTVAAFAERAGQPIGMVQYAKLAFPAMLASVAIAHIYIWLRYF